MQTGTGGKGGGGLRGGEGLGSGGGGATLPQVPPGIFLQSVGLNCAHEMRHTQMSTPPQCCIGWTSTGC